MILSSSHYIYHLFGMIRHWLATAKTARHQKDGFSLVEMSVVLIIFAVMIGTVVSLGDALVGATKRSATEHKLENIRDAVYTFVQEYNRFPCPAPMDVALEDPDFGVEDCPAGGGVEQGALPVKALRLPVSYGADAWNNKFTYAATTALTDATNFDTATGQFTEDGSISIWDAGDNDVTNPGGQAAFVVISYGPNGVGAVHRKLDDTQTDCSGAGTLEEENCDLDSVFRYTLSRETEDAAGFYDDLIVWGMKEIPNY